VGVAVKHGRRISGLPAGGGAVDEVDGSRMGKGKGLVVHAGCLTAVMDEFQWFVVGRDQGLAPEGHPIPDFFGKIRVSTRYPKPKIPCGRVGT
jgi:hypothetical protein